MRVAAASSTCNIERRRAIPEIPQVGRLPSPVRCDDALVASHSRLVLRLANRFRGLGVDFDDLVQVGSLGLVKAAQNFSPHNGSKFRTFATPYVIGEIKHHLRDYAWHLKVPRRMKERRAEFRQAKAALTQSLGRSPTLSELAHALDTIEETVIELIEMGAAYAPGPFSELPAGDPSAVSDRQSVKENAIEHMLVTKITLESAKRILTRREREILELRYVQGMSQSEIGHLQAFSQMHISRLLRGALNKMRKFLEVYGGVGLGGEVMDQTNER